MHNNLRAAAAASAVGLVLAFGAAGTASAAKLFGWGDWRPPRESICEQTAKTMLKACYYDVGDNLQTTLAACANLADAEAREDCEAEARDVRREEVAECVEVEEAREDACDVLGEDRYDPDPLLDPARSFVDPDDIPDVYAANPYVSLVAGHTYVLRGGDEWQETTVVHVTEDSREIEGVLCRVVADVVIETEGEGDAAEYTAVEVTDDWFAQDTIGNVYYCGEATREYEDGILRELEGSFEAGRELAKAGELIRAMPVAGDAHRQEFALGEAEDIVQYVDTMTAPTEEEGGDNPAIPCGPNGCVKSFEFTPLSPESTEFKFYRPGTGFVLAVGMEDGELTGEREELVCVGDSLDVIGDPACGIDDPEGLLEELCRLAPDAFCSEE